MAMQVGLVFSHTLHAPLDAGHGERTYSWKCGRSLDLSVKRNSAPSRSCTCREQRLAIAGIRAGSSRDNTPGDQESKAVLDAFFLGKAFAEALNERVGTALGEFLSDIGRQQAETQRRVRLFQDEVQERASAAARNATRQAITSDNVNQESKGSRVEDYKVATPPSSRMTSSSTGEPGATPTLLDPPERPSINIE